MGTELANGLKNRLQKFSFIQKRNLLFGLLLAVLFAPLGFNCHSNTNQAPAAAASQARPDDEDQTVHEMHPPTTEDGAPTADEKIRISQPVMISSLKAQQLGLKVKMASTADSVVPKGTPLLALYDNDCRKKHGSPLRFEAEPLNINQDTSLSALSAQAASDACLVRVDENRYTKWVSQVSATATSNDARVSEAKQVSFSKALSAWDWFFSGTGITVDVIVAVVDTGVLYTHPDLADNIYTNTAGKHGFDFVNGDDDPLDDYGHGTHVSGILGARANNGIGITGIMGSHIKIMGVKVLDNQGGGTEANIVNGIRYAADQGAHVINMSVGGKFTSPSIRDAMVYAAGKGVVMIVAAGNDGVVIDATTNFYSPSGYSKDIPGALSVGSVDAVTGATSTFSNSGPTYVWIAGPGSGGILSTYLGNTYSVLQGTSMACPAVTGAAALVVGALKSHGIAYVPSDVIDVIIDGARPDPNQNRFFRNGAVLDVERMAKLFYSRYIMAGNGGAEAAQ